jgi:elongation factor P hydroxylase
MKNHNTCHQNTCHPDVYYPKKVPVALDIARIFEVTFSASYNTVLIGGAAEPFYRPADEECSFHRIFYREDYVASSLHEAAHWLVAGEARRRLPDWGYWYAPDGRNPQQQRAFEMAEVKPQAIEWLLSVACGLCFRVSLDNLAESAGNGSAFKDRVYEQFCINIQQGVNERTQQFYVALAQAFAGPPLLSAIQVSRTELD